jgi:PilZ domain-containing protein
LSDTPKLEIVDRNKKRIHVALPVRVTSWDAEARPRIEMACTYDISNRGTRVVGLRWVRGMGDIVAVERGKNKVFCRVIWIGEEDSLLRGQIGLECVETDKNLWEAELRQLEEVFEPLLPGSNTPRSHAQVPGARVRRRFPRFAIEGSAQLIHVNGPGTVLASVKDIGEMGCLVASRTLLEPGTNLRLLLKIANLDLALKGAVRHGAEGHGLGIEFREVRKGDRSTLHHILRKLAEREQEAQPAAGVLTLAAGTY